MNIIEALRSNRPFKRPSHQGYLQFVECDSYDVQDILADDWEVKEEAELKPCAHCGSDDITLCEKEPDFGDCNPILVICKCGMRTANYMSVSEAIAAWNRRVEPDIPKPTEIQHLREQAKSDADTIAKQLEELRSLSHANSVYGKNVNGLNNRLNEERAEWNMERDALKKQIAERDWALVKLREEFDNDHRKAYHAGVAEVTSKSISDITTRGIDSYDEWKRRQK